MNIKILLANLRAVAGGWLVRAAICGCYLIAVIYFLLVALMAWRGDVWAYIIYAENPYAHLAGGLMFLLFAHILRVGHLFNGRDWKLLIAKCVMLCFSIAMALVIGELGLRYILIKQQESSSLERLREMKAKGKKVPIKSDHPMAAIIEFSENQKLVYELQPHLNMEFGHKTLRTNSRGMRSDNEYSEDKPENTMRIVGIGDSGMFGWGVEQGEDYMTVLGQNLNNRNDGIRYEVLNMGVPGYNTSLEVEAFIYKGLVFDPDIVVVGWCENDHQLPFFMLEAENFHRTDMSFLHMYLFRRKDIADVVAGRKIRSLRDYDREKVVDEIKDNAGMDGVRRALARLQEMSREHSFRLIVLGPLKSNIREILNELGIEYFNTVEKINAAEYPKEYAVHFMHPRPGGHAVIAEKFAEDLDRRGWLNLR